KALAEALKQATTFGLKFKLPEQLILTNNKITDNAAEALTEIMKYADINQLKILNLSNNAIGDIVLKALAEALKQATTFGLKFKLPEQLILTNNKITDNAVEALIEIMKYADINWLTFTLNLYRNQISENMKQGLAKHIKYNYPPNPNITIIL